MKIICIGDMGKGGKEQKKSFKTYGISYESI